MTEVQIMEKLRQVVSDEDPKLIYSKIKKVGQGYVLLGGAPVFKVFTDMTLTVPPVMCMLRRRLLRERRSLLRRWTSHTSPVRSSS